MPKSYSRKQGSALPTPLIFIAIGVLLVAAAIWITTGRPVNQAADQPSPPTATPLQATGPYPEVPRISPADARAGMESGNALMVDVRTERDFNTSRIAGALHIPASDIATRYQELPKDRPIYLYCT